MIDINLYHLSIMHEHAQCHVYGQHAAGTPQELQWLMHNCAPPSKGPPSSLTCTSHE